MKFTSFSFPDAEIEFWEPKSVQAYAEYCIPDKKLLLPGNNRMRQEFWLHQYCRIADVGYCILVEDKRRGHIGFRQPVMLTVGQMFTLAIKGGVREMVGIDLKSLYFSNLELQALLDSPHLKNRKDHNGNPYLPNLLNTEFTYAWRAIGEEGGLESFLENHWGEWDSTPTREQLLTYHLPPETSVREEFELEQNKAIMKVRAIAGSK